MGKILDVFNDNRDVIISRLSENLPKIVNLLQEKGVYKEKEKHDLLEENFYLVVKNLFSHVDAGGYYAEFVEALTEAREKVVADLVKGVGCSFTTKLEDRNVVHIGSVVTLSCCLDEKHGVRWYRDHWKISMNDKFEYKNEQLKHKLVIADIQEKDSGVYSCECGTAKTSCILKVEDCSFTTKLEDINVVDIGSDVTLSCCLDKEHGVQWYKGRSEICMNDKFRFKDKQRKHKLIITDIQEKDSGVYSCECGTAKTRCVLKVEDYSFTTKLEDINVVHIGSDVTLSCCLDKEHGVQWYKDQSEISLNKKFKFKDERLKHQLIIADIQEVDSGVYSCECRTAKTSCNLNVEDCSFTTKLEDINVVHIGSAVTLSCCLDKEHGVQWNKDQSEISLNDKFKFKDKRLKHQLIIADIQEVDSGVYSCECGRAKTSCKLNVEECSFSTKLEDRNVAGIGSYVTLSCCLDKAHGVQWYKGRSEISLNDRFKFKDERLNHQLIIADIQEKDSDIYSCECGTAKTSCILKIKAYLFKKQLENLTITSGEKLILTCELNAECKNVKWYKINGALSFRATCINDKIADSNAHQYQLAINHVKMEDAGEYRCGIENVITICNVMVRERTEIQIDASVETTELLYELNSTIARLEVTNDEILHTQTKLGGAETEVKENEIIIREREIIIEEKETEIAKLKALVKEQGDTLKIKESELENKDNYIEELEDKSEKLAESVKILESICKDLKFTKQQSAEMKEHIEKLEGEKQHLEVRVSILESYINKGKTTNEQQQAILEDISRKLEALEKKKTTICSVS